MIAVPKYVYNGWTNPDMVGWQKPRIHKGKLRCRGMSWTCANHPERRSGVIKGTGQSGTRRNCQQAYAALMLHMYAYHELPLTKEQLNTTHRAARWYNH